MSKTTTKIELEYDVAGTTCKGYPKAQRRLEAFYEPHNEQLYELLNSYPTSVSQSTWEAPFGRFPRPSHDLDQV